MDVASCASNVEEGYRPSKIRTISDSPVSKCLEVGSLSKISKENFDEKNKSFLSNNHDENVAQPLKREREDHTPEVKISKNQLKKLARRERWEANRELRTIKRREKHKEKQARKAEERANKLEKTIARGESEISESSSYQKINQDEKTKRSYSRPKQMPIGIILDVNFDELMTEKEIISLGAQLTRCYSLNKSAPYRTHLVVSSWGGALKSRFENVLASTHLQWTGINFLDEDFTAAAKLLLGIMITSDEGNLAGDLTVKNRTKNGEHDKNAINNLDESSETTKSNVNFCPSDDAPESKTIENLSVEGSLNDNSQALLQKAKEQSVLSTAKCSTKSNSTDPLDHLQTASKSASPAVIYLTSDSPNTLAHLNPNTSYIIGGIVDKNRHKGICYKRACERGIPTAKLPIGEYMKMQSRTVLAVNHVVEILLKWLETKDWGEAFLQVIPKRKQAILKTRNDSEGDHENSEGENPDECVP